MDVPALQCPPDAATRLEEYCSIEEGAAFIGITPSMLSAYCCRGELPSYKIGNKRRVKLSELEQAMSRYSTDPLIKGFGF